MIRLCRHIPAAAALLAAASAPFSEPVRAQAPGAPARPPNVVVILADDLGYGDLGAYGHPLIRTPRLDALARDGVRLTSYYAGAPACTPARAALLTGKYPQRVGLGAVLGPEATIGIPAGELTLAEALKARGYQTAVVGKWHLGHATAAHLPGGQGFDSWFGLPYSNDMIPPWVQTTVPLRLFRNGSAIDGEVDQDTLTERYTAEATAFIRGAAPKGPFFLYLPHSMPHLPIRASATFRGRSAAGLYGDVIEELDASTGAILDALAAAGVADHTIVVFTSDNGPWHDLPARMLQKGNEPWHTGTAGLLRGAKASTWEGGVRVPALVRWPGVVPAGRVSGGMATAMDLYATIATAAGAALPPGIDGHDLRAFLAGAAESPTREFFYVNNRSVEGVREGPWKLRRRTDGSGSAPELFHLERDPSERYDVASKEPAVVGRLGAKLRAFEEGLKGPR